MVLIALVIVSLLLVSLLFSVHDMLAGFVPTLLFTVPGLFVGTALTNAIDRWYRTERGRNQKTIATR